MEERRYQLRNPIYGFKAEEDAETPRQAALKVYEWFCESREEEGEPFVSFERFAEETIMLDDKLFKAVRNRYKPNNIGYDIPGFIDRSEWAYVEGTE